MSDKKMHLDEVDTSEALVRRLLASQFPHWTKLPLKEVRSAGTDNAIYQLGNDLCVRLPRIHWAVGQIDKESKWLPRLAPALPLEVPKLIAKGEPDESYPYNWAIYKWLSGENKAIEQVSDARQAALDMAQFITALQQIDTTDAPLASEHNLRGVSLKTRDKATREALKKLDGMIDTRAVAVWEEALQAPEWTDEPVWFHGDLLTGNVLFTQGRLSAVIDFGGLGVGDPAPDMMIAWSLFAGESRKLFREALGVDDATWTRGRGQALSQAAIFIPYYLDTNPLGVRYAQRIIAELIGDLKVTSSLF